MREYDDKLEALLCLGRMYTPAGTKDMDVIRAAFGPPSCLSAWEIIPMLEMAQSTPPGCFVEVGVYQGGTAHHLTRLAKFQRRQVYLYDTFEGLPCADPIDALPKGLLADVDFNRVRALIGGYARMHKCVFPHDVEFPTAPVAFAHIDVDQYKSTKEAIVALLPLMALGGVMWFDDTAGGPMNGLEGARQAIREIDLPVEVDPATGRWYARL